MNFDIIPGVSLHARQRAVQHFGRDPARADWLAAVASILDRAAMLLGKSGFDANERWRVRLANMEVDVWWSPHEAQIITVLDLGQGALNDRRTAERDASNRKRRLPEPYRRERPRVEDWR